MTNPSSDQPLPSTGATRMPAPAQAPSAQREPDDEAGDRAGLADADRGAAERADDEASTEAEAAIDVEAGGASDASELADWKDELRRDFERWLASIEEIPRFDDADDEADEIDDGPDLYSFYAQLAAASAETRKVNRRTAEAMSQWGETLTRFESGLQPLRETTAQLAAARSKEGRMSRDHCLMLIELLDRMHRLARAFESPPVAKGIRRILGASDAWRQAWQAQHQALDILVGHLEGMVRKEGVTRIDTVGQTFDPALMMAVAADPDSGRPPLSVLEEITAGYRRDSELLRAAHVKVAAGRQSLEGQPPA